MSLKSEVSNWKFSTFLENNNIQTRPIFSGNILRHPAFKKIISKRNKINSFKNSKEIKKTIIVYNRKHKKYLNKLNLKKIRNSILSEALPVRV